MTKTVFFYIVSWKKKTKCLSYKSNAIRKRKEAVFLLSH